jgi:5-methylcytosine-specific restriction endonuclease McrA
MDFSDSVVLQAWQRAGGKCECKRLTHAHSWARCNNDLVWENRGREGRGAWEAHHITAGGPDILSNCEILCWDCHKQTL